MNATTIARALGQHVGRRLDAGLEQAVGAVPTDGLALLLAAGFGALALLMVARTSAGSTAQAGRPAVRRVMPAVQLPPRRTTRTTVVPEALPTPVASTVVHRRLPTPVASTVVHRTVHRPAAAAHSSTAVTGSPLALASRGTRCTSCTLSRCVPTTGRRTGAAAVHPPRRPVLAGPRKRCRSPCAPALLLALTPTRP